MTSREKKLLAALVAVAILGAAVVGISLYLDSTKTLHAALVSTRREVATLRLIAAELPAYTALADEMKGSNADTQQEPDIPDLFAFANRISGKATAQGLRIRHSAISGTGELAVFEINLEGDIRTIISIMDSISQEAGYKLISGKVARDESTAGAEAVLRIGYAAKK